MPVHHPVFPIVPTEDEIEALQEKTRLVCGFTPSDIDVWIVLKSSFAMVACPNCEWPGGRRDRKNYWAWSEEDPDHVRCTHCGALSPSADYPLDRVERVADPTGKVQAFPYWEAPDGYQFYLQGKVENCKKQHMEHMAEALARLSVGTGETEYARQAGRILSRLADAYPHYNAQICRKEGSPVLLDIPSLDPPNGVQPIPGLAKDMQGHATPTHYPYWSNRRGDGWNGWHYSEMPVVLVRAYDWIAGSSALDDLSCESGRDVRTHIEDFFRATANFARSYPIYLGNMDPSLIRGLATIGRVIGEPVFVHDAMRRARMLLDWQLFPDGNWRECAPSYHRQAAHGLQRCVLESLAGYSDPEGYVDGEDGLHFVDLDPIGDLPLLGGRELVSDIGYTHTVLRPFACGSLAHNLVLVDRRDQRTTGDDPPTDGYLVAWAQFGDQLRFCEAGGEGVYPDLTRVYRRAIGLVGMPGGGAYAVDVFRVQGGNRHDWVLHGDADANQVLEATLDVQPFEGSLLPDGATFYRWEGAEGEYGKNMIDGVNNSYGLFEHLRVGKGEDTWQATFRYDDAGNLGLRTTVLGQPGVRIFAGDLPSIRRAQENSGAAYDFRMPAVIAAREGADLYSTFSAVHQPGLQVELEVESLALEDASEGAVGILCRGPGFTDYHLCATDSACEIRAVDLPLHARGRYAFIRVLEDGRAAQMALVDGTEVRFGKQEMTLPPGENGSVVGVRHRESGDGEDALIVDAQLRPRTCDPGERAVVRFGDGTTYDLEFSEVRREGARSVVTLTHRPGFELTGKGQGAVQTHHPHLESVGRPVVHLPASGFWEDEAQLRS